MLQGAAHSPNNRSNKASLIDVKHAVIAQGCVPYLSLAVWPSRQARNAASACSRSSALLSLRRGRFGGRRITIGVSPFISSRPCRRRLLIRDQLKLRPMSTLLSMLHIALRRDQRPGLCWDVSGIFSSGRRDDTNRRTFEPRCYGHTHAGTECLVHVEVTGIRYV